MREVIRRDRGIAFYLISSNFFLIFGFRVWQAMFNNFAVEQVGIGPAEIGWIQALREVPGLMGFLIGFLVLFLSETRLMALSIMLLGLGMVLTGGATHVPFLLVSTLVMSIGFHLFYPSSNAVVLMAVDRGRTPRVMGELRSIGAVAALVATAVVYLLAERWGYRLLFVGTGAAVILAGASLLPFNLDKEALPPRRRVIFRRKYWLYYTLAFLMGSRRHIFTTFAIFLLVKEHGISVQTAALLYFVNSLINTYAYQRIGKFVGRWGERMVLSFGFSLLILIFLGYAYIPYLPLLFALFVLDNVIFGMNMATATYLQKIAVSEEELTSNLSLEQTLNHIAAIVVPVVGGTVWSLFGAQAPFLMGVGIALVSLILAQFIRVPRVPEMVAAAGR